MTGLSRRAFLTLTGGAVAAAGMAGCGAGAVLGPRTGSTGTLLRSVLPLPEPFTTPLPVPETLTPAAAGGGHPAYRLVARAAELEILPGRRTTVLGYDGTFPGPTIRGRAGQPMTLTLDNQLDLPTVLHLHGGRTPPEHDGYPTDLVEPGTSRDYEYPLDQRAAPLWYHDHTMDFTGPNVYAGLAGMFLVDDPAEDELGLPHGERDVPLVVCDRAFDGDAQFAYPALADDRSTPGVRAEYHGGVLADCVLVNGAPRPFLEVDRARYRFRVLNASNARRYRLVLDPGGELVQVGTDQGLLEVPAPQRAITVAPGERADVVVDFAQFAVGTRVRVHNELAGGSAAQVLEFRVARRASDDSRVPDRLSRIEPIAASDVVTTRDLHFALGRSGSGSAHAGHLPPELRHRAMWSVNGITFASGEDVARPVLGTVERWRISTDVHHPVHAHLLRVQVPGPRGGGRSTGAGRAWKDTVDLLPGSAMEVLVPIEGYRGRYVLHCHNLEHEDMMMMVNFTVV